MNVHYISRMEMESSRRIRIFEEKIDKSQKLQGYTKQERQYDAIEFDEDKPSVNWF